MNDLIVKITGEVIKSNFEDYKTDIIKVIDGVNTDLKTDQDFALAEDDTKKLKEAEKAIAEVRTKSLEETASVNDLFVAMTEISEKIRSTRLSLEKKVKNKKVQIKGDLIKKYWNDTNAEIKQSKADPAAIGNFNAELSLFTAAAKNKKTVASTEKSLDECKDAIIKNFTDFSAQVDANILYLFPIKEKYPTSFHDYSQLLVMKDHEALCLIAESRVTAAISEAKAANEKKAADLLKAEEAKKLEEEKKDEQLPEQKQEEPAPTPQPAKMAKPVYVKTKSSAPGPVIIPAATPQVNNKYVMTVEIDCQKDVAVEIATKVNGLLKFYKKEVISVKLRKSQ